MSLVSSNSNPSIPQAVFERMSAVATSQGSERSSRGTQYSNISLPSFAAMVTAMLKNSSAVEGHSDPAFHPTASQESFFNHQGKRAWYSTTELMLMTPLERAATGVDLTGYDAATLETMLHTDPDHKFYVPGS